MEATQWLRPGDFEGIEIIHPDAVVQVFGQVLDENLKCCSQPIGRHGYVTGKWGGRALVCPGTWIIVYSKTYTVEGDIAKDIVTQAQLTQFFKKVANHKTKKVVLL